LVARAGCVSHLACCLHTCSNRAAQDTTHLVVVYQDPRRDPSQILTRQGLVYDVTSKGLLNLVPEPIKQLYAILESEFSPLHLCQKLAPLLEQLETMDEPLSAASPVHDVSLGQYKNTLQQVGTKHRQATSPLGTEPAGFAS
jgi:hypothetical protein